MRTVTAAELIEELQNIPEDAQVVFASDYGNHCHTQQIVKIEGSIEKVAVKESCYSDSGYAVNEDEDSEKTVYLIR